MCEQPCDLQPALVHVHEVPVAGETRTNLTLAEPDGVVTKLNLPGPELSAAEATALLDTVIMACDESTEWVAGCGSLPPGARTARTLL